MSARVLRVTGGSAVWSPDRAGIDPVVIECVDGRVAGPGPDGSAAAVPADGSVETLDAAGGVVTPGLVNAHHHLLQSAFRTLPGTRGVEMAVWLARMREAYVAARVDPELVEVAARVALAESLLCGVTTVADHHLTWPAGGVTGDGMRQLAVGPSGVHADGPETFAALGEVAGGLGLRRRTQSNEQVDVARAAEKYGRRPIELLDEWGWLAPDVTLAHLCHITGSEVELLRRSGITATHAPACDLPMGWGVAPVARLLDAGVTVGLGTSGGGSNDAGHLLADARLAMQVAPLAGRPLDALEVLTMATAGGADGLGRPELGRLTPGAAADLVVWDVSGVADAGVADPVRGLLWAAPGRRPRHVVVGGRVVVRDFELVTADERELAGDLRRECGRRGIGR